MPCLGNLVYFRFADDRKLPVTLLVQLFAQQMRQLLSHLLARQQLPLFLWRYVYQLAVLE